MPRPEDKPIIRIIVDASGKWFNEDGTQWTREQAYAQANEIWEALRASSYTKQLLE